jgi:hypothetical protein
MTITEEVGITSKTQAELPYVQVWLMSVLLTMHQLMPFLLVYAHQITAISWDHANSEVKLVFKSSEDRAEAAASENFLILTLGNTIEFEGEMKLRISSMVASTRGAKVPTTMYVGVFAGATKPKPFQRKRPNLSRLPAGKLPSLQVMRNLALDLHRGSYKPCPQGSSRRVDIALQHIYDGFNTFPLLGVRGPSSISNQWRNDSTLVIADECLMFKPRGSITDTKIEFSFDDIQDWNAIDNDGIRSGDSGIEITSRTGDSVYFGVEFIRDVKHTLEYFWNRYKVSNGQGDQVKLGSTHGRPIVSVSTLAGDVPPPADSAQGHTEVVDQDGLIVRPGGKMAMRRASINTGIIQQKEPKIVPPENRDVKPHWHKVVLHQGWLLKQGGVGVGTIKSWIKRYFVLYKTSQGHFLVYYSDFTECPMYTAEKNHRNFVDMAKCTFIRPGSNKQDNPDTPPHCFDIVTTEREWTLCAESQDNAQRWLKLLTKAVDEDVAILPDEELLFKVKPKVDPLGVLPSTDYTTSLKVSAHGISVTTPSPKEGQEIEHYFWVYTDFYKWSLLSQSGKLALLVNVFADASFSRRIEYIFRNKDAQRLATAIEFFIEKFMTLMHIRLETTEGAFDEVPTTNGAEEDGDARLHKLDEADALEQQQQYGQELDLLGLDMGEMTVSKPTVSAPQHNADPFSDSFGAPPPPPSVPPPAQSSNFDPFGDDPFGSDPFGSPVEIAPPAAGPKLAPPLTAEQNAQHRRWMIAAVGANGGPLYDDGTLQVATKIETRGSQCRFSFMHINQSPGAITDFKVTVSDPAGLMRFELGQLPSSHLDGLARVTQVMMLECIKPAAPIPQVTFSYTDTLLGKRSNTLDLPLIVTTFNEPLALAAPDFSARWQQLVAPGQEAQEVIKPSYPVVPAQVHSVLSSVSSSSPLVVWMVCMFTDVPDLFLLCLTDTEVWSHPRPSGQLGLRRLRRCHPAHWSPRSHWGEAQHRLHGEDRDERSGQRHARDPSQRAPCRHSGHPADREEPSALKRRAMCSSGIACCLYRR